MQRASLDLLRESWADRYFFEPLAEFMARFHEDRGGETLSVVIFSPEGEELPPIQPPVHLLILYREPVDFLRDNLFLRERDPSGMFVFFSYGIDSFRNMLRDSNPLAIGALNTGLVLFEREGDIKDLITS